MFPNVFWRIRLGYMCPIAPVDDESPVTILDDGPRTCIIDMRWRI